MQSEAVPTGKHWESWSALLASFCAVRLAEESRTKGAKKLDEYCEASADGLLRHALADQSHQSFEQMLDTLELAALYLWLGRNGEEAQAKARHAAAEARPWTPA